MSIATDFEAPVDRPRVARPGGPAREGRARAGDRDGSSRSWPGSGRPRSDDEATRAARFRLWIGGLHMFDGRFEEAARVFEAARDVHPGRPELFGANIEALLGVAALRRGETENCVACCTEASCIFPLAAAAVHRRPPARARRSATSPPTWRSGPTTSGCAGS